MKSRPAQLTERQAVVFKIVSSYYRAVGEACPAAVVARKLNIHHEAARGHFAALHRKGWLVSGFAPAIPRRSYLFRRG